ncbi:MAG: hypothetical protein ACOYU7_06140 [Bacillota bacterium]
MAEVSPNLQQTDVRAEMEAQEWFDLLPVEKRLMGWSLGLGVVLLVIFIIIFRLT